MNLGRVRLGLRPAQSLAGLLATRAESRSGWRRCLLATV